ncbi:unnamed protein product [Lepidochelys kempii]
MGLTHGVQALTRMAFEGEAPAAGSCRWDRRRLRVAGVSPVGAQGMLSRRERFTQHCQPDGWLDKLESANAFINITPAAYMYDSLPSLHRVLLGEGLVPHPWLRHTGVGHQAGCAVAASGVPCPGPTVTGAWGRGPWHLCSQLTLAGFYSSKGDFLHCWQPHLEGGERQAGSFCLRCQAHGAQWGLLGQQAA